MARKVRVFTHTPSPYQVELFDAIAQSGRLELDVCYLYSTSPIRMWEMPEINHQHVFMNEDRNLYTEVERSFDACDLVVFNYYQHSLLLGLIKRREQRGKAWCFWGERPGYRRLGRLGLLYRMWRFSILLKSDAPIWGMGEWAVARYREEYGEGRLYCNVPYFSDLSRFKRGENHRRNWASKTFLYAGSLTHRKGVDHLARAFGRVADECPEVRLKIIGEGKLRGDLERQLARHGDRVEFAGFQKWEALPRFYHTANILCVPSRYDGWNLVVPEGLAAGLPVISTDQTGAALELIKHGENGWIVPSEDAESLYQSMREAALLTQPSLTEMSIAAETSVARHSIADGVERFHQAVHATLEAHEKGKKGYLDARAKQSPI
jgi:glycosyltransferase involved in cell wall biosynthesis